MRIATILFALAPIVAVTQPLIPQKLSLEAQALNTKYIVVGTIVRVQKPKSGDLTLGAVIKMEQALKGVGVLDEQSSSCATSSRTWKSGTTARPA